MVGTQEGRAMSTPLQTIKLYWQHMRQRKLQFYSILALSGIAVIISQFMGPLIIAAAFDKLNSAPISQLHLWHDFGWLFVLYALVNVATTILWRAIIWILWSFENEIRRELDMRCFSYLTNQSYDFHSNHFAGALVSQTTKFVNAFENLFDMFTFSIVTNVIAFVATTIILLPKSPLYVSIFLAASLLYVLVVFVRTKKQQPYNNRSSNAQSEQTAQLADALTNAQTIKTFAREKFELMNYGKFTSRTVKLEYETRGITTINDTIFSAMNNGMGWMALFFGVFLVLHNHSPIGTLYLVSTYTLSLLERLWELNNNMRSITRSFGDANDMTALLALDTSVSDVINPEPLRSNRGEIVFENICFAYDGDKGAPLFKDMSLHIKPGEKIGLVGTSGGGKTTITKLLLRFMDIRAGRISIDHQDISQLSQADLRSKITYVAQEPILFHRTLAENIRYGQLDASDEAVVAAAKMANAHEFISQLSDGYNTLVGERGIKLSGGQRQRIAIARAVLKNAPILVLDEATSALDSESEVLIQDALWKLMEGRTAIVIAHRLSTIQKMDRILVLDKGKIVEEGSHKELVRKKGGTYAGLWAHQSGGFIEE